MYKWGFPFKLIMNYNQNRITVRKIRKAEQLLQQRREKSGNVRREGKGGSADTNGALNVQEVVTQQLQSCRESLILHHNSYIGGSS